MTISRRKESEVRTVPYSYRITLRFLYNAYYHRQHYTLQAFEQFRAYIYSENCALLASKHDTLTQCISNAGPPSATLIQHYNNMPHFCRIVREIRLLGYERVYLPLYKVADTPFYIQVTSSSKVK